MGRNPLQTALRVPKSLDERMVEEERNETLYKAVGSLPEYKGGVSCSTTV